MANCNISSYVGPMELSTEHHGTLFFSFGKNSINVLRMVKRENIF